jgi:two-component system, response regulator, stage 0 sporulation protein F
MNRVDVVIIDDDEGIRWVLQELLVAQGISCMAARNGQEGLQQVFRYRPALAIVDIKLGAMNGLEVAQCIHENDQNVKILFITGYKETIEGKVNGDIPVVGIVEKPFNINLLLQHVQKWLKPCDRVADASTAYS